MTVPLSDDQLERLKCTWKARLERFCRRHGLKVIEGKVNIYIEYIDVWAKLLHRFNYNGRHWSENYAEYSNEDPDCPDPPDWLEGYENKARVKGWWSNLKNIVIDKKEDRAKLSPYTGKPMRYLWRLSYNSLIEHSGGDLGCVEFIRGQPIESSLSQDQLDWLKGVMKRTIYDEDESLDPDTS